VTMTKHGFESRWGPRSISLRFSAKVFRPAPEGPEIPTAPHLRSHRRGSRGQGRCLHPKPGVKRLAVPYREVLGVELPWLDDVIRAKRPQSLPVVLTRDEVRAVLERLDGIPRLMAMLLYGAGLRLLECCRLRAKDVDFATNQLVIRDGKGRKDA
jgi:integrase